MLLIAAAGTTAYWIGQGASGGLQAGALLFGLALVLAGWGLVAAAIGEFNTTIGILSLIFAVIWVGASAVYSRHG